MLKQLTIACLTMFAPLIVIAEISLAQQQWINAIAERNNNLLRQLLGNKSININAQDAEGKTALMVAAIHGDGDLTNTLLGYGSRIDLTNHRGGTALMYAAARNQLPAIRQLVSHRADMNIRAENGWTALTLAAAKGNDDIVRYLLDHGANPNIPDVYGWTPLMRAIQHHRIKTIHYLLNDAQLEINQINNKGQTALHIATLEKDCAAIKQLLTHGATPSLRDFKNNPITIPVSCQ